MAALKKFKNLVIGGIENKVVNLILISILLVAAVFLSFMTAQERMLSDLTQETSERQLTSITGTTENVINTVIVDNMDRVTEMEARLADELFHDLAVRVQMMAEYAEKILSDPDSVQPMPWQFPDASHNGELFVKVLLANGLDAKAIEDRLGLLANLSDMMVSLCVSHKADNIFFTLPEGATLMADTVPGNWIDEDGSYIPYNAPDRYWYRQAVEAESLVFSDVESDHRNGKLCVTCAMPVYGKDHVLLGVAGADLYLDEMQAAVAKSSESGGLLVVVNESGHVILAPEGQTIFWTSTSRRAADLRESDNAELAAFVQEAMQGKTDVRLVPLQDSRYYMIGVPMHTVGWTMIAAFNEADSRQPILQLQADYEGIQKEATTAYQSTSSRRRVMIQVILFILLVALLAGAILLGKRIVKPLNTITARLADLDEDHLEFKMEDAYRTGDEVEELAESFAAISRKTLEYLDTVKRVTAEKERIGTELSLATQIQAAMLPHIVPAFPDRNDFDIVGTMDPAKEVGGDFYDYFLIDSDHLCMVMADVSGKGVPAALFMMASKIILHSVAMMGSSPAEILAKTNEAVCSNNEAQMFVTTWVGILELSTGKLTCANAGHEYPVFQHRGRPFELYKDKHGFVIGGFASSRYKEYELHLEPGSKLFVYTDGVPEATNSAEELFGTDRMLEALNKAPEADPMQVLRNVRSAVDAFVQNAEQFDDLTMLCLEYKGPKAQAQG